MYSVDCSYSSVAKLSSLISTADPTPKIENISYSTEDHKPQNI